MAKKGKTGGKQAASPLNGTVPPPEHRFKPGETGNPNGRPKSRPLTEALKQAIDDKDTLQSLIKVAISKAKAGDFRFWAEILNRVDGKVLDQLDVTTDGDKVGSGFDWLGNLSSATKSRIVKEMGGPGNE